MGNQVGAASQAGGMQPSMGGGVYGGSVNPAMRRPGQLAGLGGLLSAQNPMMRPGIGAGYSQRPMGGAPPFNPGMPRDATGGIASLRGGINPMLMARLRGMGGPMAGGFGGGVRMPPQMPPAMMNRASTMGRGAY